MLIYHMNFETLFCEIHIFHYIYVKFFYFHSNFEVKIGFHFQGFFLQRAKNELHPLPLPLGPARFTYSHQIIEFLQEKFLKI